ncbi:MAG TPA: DMT family transporter [Pseudolabrys sp.]|nr:DMT family transporter [Pseudolabrys sp.]
MSDPSSAHVTRPLNSGAAALVVFLCLCWGFNQVSVKLAIHDIPPLMQGATRSFAATLLVAGWCRLRGMPIFGRDGSLTAGIAAGILFGLEFVLIYKGLLYTTATRAVLFIYLAPFFVVLGTRIFLPADRFGPQQWLGLALSFGGMMLAFGVPTPALDPRQTLGDVMMVGAALAWAATTLIIKASSLNRVASEKVLLYQLAISVPMFVMVALIDGEHVAHMPSLSAIGALTYQTLTAMTFVIWFALIVRYSANRLSAFTFLTPLFGVAAGHLVLDEPLTPAFVAAVALVVLGLVLVNRR